MKKLIPFLLVSCMLAACGSKDNSSSATSSEASESNFTSGECSTNVANDYDRLATLCRSNEEDGKRCHEEAHHFLEKYPGISCEMPEAANEARAHTINSARIERLMDQAQAPQEHPGFRN